MPQVLPVGFMNRPVETWLATNSNARSQGCAIRSGLAYSANNSQNRFDVIDITDPVHPTLVTGYTAPAANTAGVRDVKLVGNYALVTLPILGQLTVIDISVPRAPVFVTGITAPQLAGIRRGAIHGNYALFASSTQSSIAVVDVATPSAPVYVTNIQGPSPGTSLISATDIKMVGNYGVVAVGGSSGSLAIIDFSTPASPVWVTGVTGHPGFTGTFGVCVNNGYAFVAAQSTLTAFNISNITSPFQVGQIFDDTLFNQGMHVDVKGSTAYMPCLERDSLAVIDISTPSNLRFLREIRGPSPGTTMNQAYFVLVSGNYAYVPCALGGLTSVSIP